MFLLALLLGAQTASAQYQHSRWLHADATFTNFDYQQPSTLEQKAQLAGVRGEVGVNILGFVAFSAAGEYQDGHTDAVDSSNPAAVARQTTNDFMSDLRAMAHVVFSPIVISGGIAQRFWYDNPINAPHRRTTYSYHPVQFSYFMGNTYVTVEEDFWTKGHARYSNSETGGLAHDVDYALGKGSGVGAEIGIYIPGTLCMTHIFVRYHKWNVKASDTVNDGVADSALPDNSLTLIQGGIGLAF